MHRFASNNWAVHILTTVLNEVRDWPETHKHMFTRSTVLGRMKKAFKTIEPNSSTWKESEYQSRMPRDARVIDYTTAQFRISREDTITDDVWLSSLALNVKAFPTGDEAGVLTLAVELVRARPELDCLLSKLVDFARTHNLTAPSYTVRKDKASLVGWMKVAATKPSKSFGDLPEKKADSGQEDGDAEADAVADADADEEVVVDDQDGESVEHDTATADFGGMSVVDDNSAVEDGELDLFAQYETFGMFPPSMFEGAGFN
jgi:hypothetical protein